MSRKALVVTGAAGDVEVVESTLHRFGFGTVAHVPAIAQLLEQLRQDHFDLVIVPLQQLDAAQLAEVERELRRERFTFVIGTAPEADPDVMLRAMRAGIHEFLVSPSDVKDLSAAVDRLMRRMPSEATRGEVVAVLSNKGGLGSTSVAVNLASGFARNHPNSRSALIDLVVTGGDVRLFLNLQAPYDMGDLVEKLDRIDNDLLTSLLAPTDDGVWVLVSPDDPEADELIDGGTVAAVVGHMRSHFAFTVIDCEHHMTERTLGALDAADRVLLVTQLRVDALRSAQRTLTLCKRLGYAADKVRVVVNRYQSSDVLSLGDAAEVLKQEVYFKIPNDYAASTGALTKGEPVAQFAPDSKLAASYRQLAAKLGGGVESVTATNGNGHRASGSTRLRQLFARKRS